MNWSEGSLGRVFVVRLEEGEVFNDTVETFARKRGVDRGMVFLLGGADAGSSVVVGPAVESRSAASAATAITPLLHSLAAPHETLAVGTLFPGPDGQPTLHMHAAAGREGGATVGCTRAGMVTWLVAEVVILEIMGTNAARRVDPATGFELLQAG